MNLWRKHRKEVSNLANTLEQSVDRSSTEEASEIEEIIEPNISDVEMYSVDSDNGIPFQSFDIPGSLNHEHFDSLSSEEDKNVDYGLNEKLRNWALKNNCTRQCVNEILEIFRQLDYNVPKDCRTLLTTKRDVNQVSMGLGHYVYVGVEKCIKKLLEYQKHLVSIDLIINIDGLPLFKSSSLNLWPILIQFGPFQPIAVAFYCGRSKPPFQEFLKNFVEEMSLLIEDGVVVDNIKYPVKIVCFTCDAPARALLKGIVQHTGYHACERCTIKGVSAQKRIVFDQDVGVHEDRLDEIFRANGYNQPDNEGKCHQNQVSGLINLRVDLIKDIALDPMHLVYLGVTRRILYFLRGSFRKITDGKLSASFLSAISKQLDDLALPDEFSRQPRGLSDLDRWKATEFKSFLLYSGPVVLRSFISSSSWKHFLSLSIAIRLLSEENSEIRKRNIYKAKMLLEYFVANAHVHYGKAFAVYNVHGLLHLPDDVEYYQAPLIKFSCFQFENHLQFLKRSIRGKSKPLSQISKRSEELDGSYYIKKEQPIKMNNVRKNSCFLTASSVVFIKQIQIDGKFQCDVYAKSNLTTFFNVFNIDSTILNMFSLKTTLNPRKTIIRREELLKKCVFIPYKDNLIIIPIL